MRRALAAALAIGLALTCAPAAFAGTNGTWTPVSQPYNQNYNVPGLYRSPDGILHVVTLARGFGDATKDDIAHAGVQPSGAVGTLTPVVTDWEGIDSPDIAPAPAGGLATLWGGIHSTTTGDPYDNGGLALSSDGGATWALQPDTPFGTSGTAGGTYAYAAQMALTNSQNVLFQGWSSSTGTWVHRTTDGNVAANNYQTALGGYGTLPGFGIDGSNGSLWLAWQAWQTTGSKDGVYVQQVDQSSGAPVGSPTIMPGTLGTGAAFTILGHTPITGRAGRPGVWAAYRSDDSAGTRRVLVWKVGDPAATTLLTTKENIRQVAITSDPDGRVIVVWGEGGGAGKVFLRESSTDASTWGPAFAAGGLPKAVEGWALEASAQSGGLVDLVQNYTEADGTMRFSHTQATPPPILAKAVDASLVSGVVLIKLPGSNSFTALSHASQIPVGSVVDATKGRVRIEEALPGGRTASADFYEGEFRVTQTHDGVATMALVGTAAGGKAASAAKAKVLRQLWGNGKGKFRTKGKFASAAIRGTTWLVADRTDGTLVRVTKGAVTVTDFRRHKTFTLGRGKSYLAKR